MKVHRRHYCQKYSNKREKIQCEICGSYLGRQEMWKHINYVHNKVNKATCDFCGMEMRRDHLPSHFSIHLETKNKIPCEICGKVIIKDWMKNHMNFVHYGKQRYVMKKCQICGKEVVRMDSHMKTHSEKVKCPHCDKLFSKHSLNRHIKAVHNKEAPTSSTNPPAKKLKK